MIWTKCGRITPLISAAEQISW